MIPLLWVQDAVSPSPLHKCGPKPGSFLDHFTTIFSACLTASATLPHSALASPASCCSSSSRFLLQGLCTCCSLCQVSPRGSLLCLLTSLFRCYLLSTAFPHPPIKSNSPLVANPPDPLPCIRFSIALRTIGQTHFMCLLTICPLHLPLACQHHESTGPPSCLLLYPSVENRAWPTVGA